MRVPRLFTCLTVAFLASCRVAQPATADAVWTKLWAHVNLQRDYAVMVAQAQDKLSAIVLPCKGETILSGNWRDPRAETETVVTWRRQYRAELQQILTNLGILVVDPGEEALDRSYRLAVEAMGAGVDPRRQVGRQHGVSLVVVPTKDVFLMAQLRVSRWTGSSSWDTRTDTTCREDYLSCDSSAAIAVATMDSRASRSIEREFEADPLYESFLLLQEGDTGAAVQKLALLDEKRMSWVQNAVAARKLLVHARTDAQRAAAERFLGQMLAQQPGDSFLHLWARSCYSSFHLDRTSNRIADWLAAARRLPKGHPWAGWMESEYARMRQIDVASARQEIDQVIRRPGEGDAAARTSAGARSQAAAPGAARESVAILQVTLQGGSVRRGTGVFTQKAGLLVTCAHVVEGALSIRVVAHDGRAFSANVVKQDQLCDLAAMQVDADYPRLRLRDSAIAVGAPLLCYGAPVAMGPGDDELTLTSGIVSALRSVDGVAVVQTDASINPGNSGGPILDDSQQIVGIVSFKWRGTEGIGFGISHTEVSRFLSGIKPAD